MKRVSNETSDINEVVTKLKEENANLITQLQESKKTISELENEIVEYKDQRYNILVIQVYNTGNTSI